MCLLVLQHVPVHLAAVTLKVFKFVVCVLCLFCFVLFLGVIILKSDNNYPEISNRIELN